MPSLLHRLKRRIRGKNPPKDDLRLTWSEAEPYAKEAIQNISASFVSSWEVATAALYRVGTARWDEAEVTAGVNRFSDGLVPTTEALSGVEHQIVGAWRLAADDGNTLAERLPRLRALLTPLGPETTLGWEKTVAYIQPTLEGLAPSEASFPSLQSVGVALGQGLSVQVEQLMTTLEALPDAPTQAELIHCLLTFGEGACRVVEVEMDAVRCFIQSDG